MRPRGRALGLLWGRRRVVKETQGTVSILDLTAQGGFFGRWPHIAGGCKGELGNRDGNRFGSRFGNRFRCRNGYRNGYQWGRGLASGLVGLWSLRRALRHRRAGALCPVALVLPGRQLTSQRMGCGPVVPRGERVRTWWLERRAARAAGNHRLLRELITFVPVEDMLLSDYWAHCCTELRQQIYRS